MSGLNSENGKGYSKYDKMSTESLEELLRLDAELPDGEGADIDEILYISEVIAEREKKQPTGRLSEVDVDTAWETFRAKYLPYATDGRSLYDFDDDEPGRTEVSNPVSGTAAPHSRPVRGRRRLNRAVTFAAAVAVLLGLMTATAYAMGYDLWEVVAQWTKDTFTFASISKVNIEEDPNTDNTLNNEGYISLQEALSAYGVTESLVPSWFPDHFNLEMISVDENTERVATIFWAWYKFEEKSIIIQINMYQNPNETHYATWQKDDIDVDIIEIGNCTFYLMQNAGKACAIWSNGPFECNISGDISSNELLKMLESIFN